MKINFLVFLTLVIAINLNAQTCPTTVRVGTSCSCHSCSGTVDVLNYTTYIKRVLPQEWLNCWGSQTNGMNSLQAGAVAIRSYTIPRISSTSSSHGVNYDICATTCCHAYGTSQFTNSNNAVDNTADLVLVSGSSIQLTEYAAEQNKYSACGDGYKGNGTSSWPCTSDGPCTGQSYNGHGRGMCQNGTARWATGLNLINSSCTWQSSHGYGTKTWQQILAHYYPNWTIATCGIVVIVAPLCDNDDPCSPKSLSIGSSCNNTNCSTVNSNPPSSTIPYSGGTSCSSNYQSGRYDDDVWFTITPLSTNQVTIKVTPTSNTGNFDVSVGVYQGSCSNLSQVTCADSYGNGATENLIFTPTTSTTYYIRVFSYGIGTTYSGNFQICATSASTCTPPTNITFTGTKSVCSGGTTNISVSASNCGSGCSYQWSGGMSSGSSKNLSQGNYTVTATSSCGSTATASVSISSATAPGTPSIAPTSGCSPLSVTANSSGCGSCTYLWNNGTPSATIQITASGTYAVTVTNSSNCTVSGLAGITVTSAPTPDAGINSSTGNSFCNGQSTTLSVPICTGCSYNWNTGSTDPSITVSSSGTYRATVTNSCGASDNGSITISVNNPPPQPGNISGSAIVCEGASQTYSVASVSGATNYTWDLPPGWSGNSTSRTINATADGNNGTISVTANNDCGSSAPRILQVTVNQTPIVSVNPPSVSICTGGSAQLEAVGTAQSYTWSPTTGLNPTNGQFVTASPTSTKTYKVTAANGNCTATASATVTVSNQLSASIYPANAVLCYSGTKTLTASPGTGFSWSGPNFSGSTQSVTVSNDGNYNVTVTNPGGCQGSATAAAFVDQNPPLFAEAGGNHVIQQGATAILGGSTTASGGTPPYVYTWTPANGLSDASAENPLANPGTNTAYTVLVTDAEGCTAISQVTIQIITVINEVGGQNQISIYPNPNNGTFRITGNFEVDKTIYLKVFTGIGQLCDVQKISTQSKMLNEDIWLKNLTTGVYYIQLMVDNKSYYQKLIIETDSR